MGNKRTDSRSTLANALDLTRWDFNPGEDRKILLQPVGAVFADLPWEVRPQYLGPAPISEDDGENGDGTDNSEDTDTQPIPPLERS
jgi:hypothetical protein